VGNRSEPYRWLLRVHNNLSATAAAAKPTGAKDGCEGIPTLQVERRELSQAGVECGHPNVGRVRSTRNLRRHWQWLLLQSATCGRVDRITLVHFVLFNLARNKKGPPKQPGF